MTNTSRKRTRKTENEKKIATETLKKNTSWFRADEMLRLRTRRLVVGGGAGSGRAAELNFNSPGRKQPGPPGTWRSAESAWSRRGFTFRHPTEQPESFTSQAGMAAEEEGR